MTKEGISQRSLEEDKLFDNVFWNKCSFYYLVFKHEIISEKEAEELLIRL